MSHGNGEAAQSYIQVTPKCFPCRGQCPPPDSDRGSAAHSPSHGGMDAAKREATPGGGRLHRAVSRHLAVCSPPQASLTAAPLAQGQVPTPWCTERAAASTRTCLPRALQPARGTGANAQQEARGLQAAATQPTPLAFGASVGIFATVK